MRHSCLLLVRLTCNLIIMNYSAVERTSFYNDTRRSCRVNNKFCDALASRSGTFSYTCMIGSWAEIISFSSSMFHYRALQKLNRPTCYLHSSWERICLVGWINWTTYTLLTLESRSFSLSRTSVSCVRRRLLSSFACTDSIFCRVAPVRNSWI